MAKRAEPPKGAKCLDCEFIHYERQHRNIAFCMLQENVKTYTGYQPIRRDDNACYMFVPTGEGGSVFKRKPPSVSPGHACMIVAEIKKGKKVLVPTPDGEMDAEEYIRVNYPQLYMVYIKEKK